MPGKLRQPHSRVQIRRENNPPLVVVFYLCLSYSHRAGARGTKATRTQLSNRKHPSVGIRAQWRGSATEKKEEATTGIVV